MNDQTVSTPNDINQSVGAVGSATVLNTLFAQLVIHSVAAMNAHMNFRLIFHVAFHDTSSQISLLPTLAQVEMQRRFLGYDSKHVSCRLRSGIESRHGERCHLDCLSVGCRGQLIAIIH